MINVTIDRAELLTAIKDTIDKIVDPCSVAAGAPAGLVAMGLVRDIDLEDRADGTHVSIDMCITEPGCMMASIFELTVHREVLELAGVSAVHVAVDHGFVWDPSLMAPEYRTRLEQARASAAERMKTSGLVDLGLPTQPPASAGQR